MEEHIAETISRLEIEKFKPHLEILSLMYNASSLEIGIFKTIPREILLSTIKELRKELYNENTEYRELVSEYLKYLKEINMEEWSPNYQDYISLKNHIND